MENGGTFPKQEWENEKVAFSPELPYESRYFSVDLSEDGTGQSSDTGQIAAVDFSMAVRYAKSILKSGKTQGFVGNYRYLVSDDADKVQIVFLDCGKYKYCLDLLRDAPAVLAAACGGRGGNCARQNLIKSQCCSW